MKNLWTLCMLCTLALTMYSCQPAGTESTPEGATPATPPPVEFGDAKYADIAKRGTAALSAGDITSWLNDFANNAVYIWNNGDSLAGKDAISAYWTKRRTETIETLTFSENIYLPLKINQPQATEEAGVWVLSWYRVDAKYKTGKSMTQWIHSAAHFDASDKIDRFVQYLDRVPINEATAQ